MPCDPLQQTNTARRTPALRPPKITDDAELSEEARAERAGHQAAVIEGHRELDASLGWLANAGFARGAMWGA
jgi:hypothetical protein